MPRRPLIRMLSVGILLLTIVVTMWTPTTQRGAHTVAGQQLVRKLDVLETDAAAHAIGAEWHNNADTPMVVNLGDTAPEEPIAGMDQWLATRGVKPQPRGKVTGEQKFLIIRVYFDDYNAVSCYAKDAADEALLLSDASGSNDPFCGNVEDDLMVPQNTLWKNTSYNNISFAWDITDLYELPKNRSAYIDDYDDGDLSEDGKFDKLFNDAINVVPSSYNFNDYEGVLVFMSERNTLQFHRGQATVCNTSFSNNFDLPGVENNTDYGCVIMSENPSDSAVSTYGRMGHELGHAFQQGGPAHPSNYDSEFELLDSNMPGQTGAFEKQEDMAFPGWLPKANYIEITSKQTTDRTCIRVLEQVPDARPQVIKVPITGSRYYLISARVKMLGDELNSQYGGIPDEGILVERVNTSPGKGNPWVTIIGEGDNRNDLFEKGDINNDVGDSIFIDVLTDTQSGINDPDIYCVRIRFTAAVNEPDVGLRPWREAPGNSYETTDIWIDSPLNGYDIYRNGTWNDLSGVPVPRGNGDAPAVGSLNRLYARVRNLGTIDATNVVVKFHITDPGGVGVSGSDGWALLGSVDKNTFPALAVLPAGGYTDVYLEWTPDYALTDDQVAAGVFEFHTCIRVTIDPVAGEVTLGNQDGEMEQENVVEFEATPDEPSPIFTHAFNLHNDDAVNSKTFNLQFKSNTPPSWSINLNEGDLSVTVPANTYMTIPITVTVDGAAVLGSDFTVEVNAHSIQNLLSSNVDTDDDGAIDVTLPTDPLELVQFYAQNTHVDRVELGGFDFTVNVLAPTDVSCRVYGRSARVVVQGGLDGFEGIHQAGTPLKAYVQLFDQYKQPISLDDRASFNIGSNGAFNGSFSAATQDKMTIPKFARCIFPGTHLLASDATDYIEIDTTNAAPTLTPEPWGGSQFHHNMNVNQFLPPGSTYSDRVSLSSVAVRQYACPATGCPVSVKGMYGRAVQFTPANDGMLQSTTSFNLNTTFSVALWARRSTFDKAETLVSHGVAGVNTNFNMGFDDNGHFICGIYGDEVASQRPILDSDWHHYVCIINARQRTLYVDNNAVASRTSSSLASYNVTNRFVVARRPDQQHSFSGEIDEINIFNVAINTTTINTLVRFLGQIPTQVPIGVLSFNDVSIPIGQSKLYCEGGTCPSIYYPDRTYVARPSERIGVMQMAKGKTLQITSSAALVAGSDSTMMFWARFGNTLSDLGSLVQNGLNRPSVTVIAPNRISYAGLIYQINATQYPHNRWYHMAFVKKGQTLQIFINGNMVAQGLGAATLLPFRVSNTTTMTIGGIDASNGEMSAFELVNSALTANDITKRYATGIGVDYVSPTLTLTASPTASPTRRPIITIPPIKPVTATFIARQTQTATHGVNNKLTAIAGTSTRMAGLTRTKVANDVNLTETQWAQYGATETALAATATRFRLASRTSIVVIPTITFKIPTLTVYKSMTPTQTHTPSKTPTASKTATPTRSPTQMVRITMTFTRSPTSIVRVTFTKSPTPQR